MKIAILDDYQDCVRHLDCFAHAQPILQRGGHEIRVFTNSARGLGQLAIRLAPFDVLVLIRERTALRKALLDRLPNLRLIVQTGRIGTHIDLDAARARGIEIAEGAGDPTAPAELTWALIMAATRKLPQYASHLRQGLWQTVSTAAPRNTLGVVLKGRTLGIWGYGRIGRMVADYGRAFGMRVLVWGSAASRAQAVQDGHYAAPSREEFFGDCDVLSLHLRLTDQTRGIVGAGDLARMKPQALFVNTSRAELVQAGALEAALEQGRPGQAALDVFEHEPLPLDSPLLRLPNVLATPHIGFVEKDSYERYFGAALRSVLDFSARPAAGMTSAASGDPG
jgi:D-3-phosphoglycerate dehydrogenase / 2-oxoglutarate reductase